jgi:predicted ATPase
MHITRATFRPNDYPTRDHYPFTLPVLQQTTSLPLDTPITLFVGENGTGKSTVLEAIARRCGIHIWRDEERTRFEHNPYEDHLRLYTDIEWTAGQVPGSFFSAGIFHHFVEALDEWAASDPGQLDYFGGKSLVTQSHGQSLMSFFRSRYRIRGLYLLDEPETALSPRTQLELLDLLTREAEDGHAQFIIATHSPILMSLPGARLLSFDASPVTEIDYRDTDHYQIYRNFFIQS